MSRRVGMLALFAAIAIFAIAGWITYADLQDAYGAGPPYFSRTTNMDKWTSPWLRLIVIDLAALAAIAGLLYWAKGRRQKTP